MSLDKTILQKIIDDPGTLPAERAAAQAALNGCIPNSDTAAPSAPKKSREEFLRMLGYKPPLPGQLSDEELYKRLHEVQKQIRIEGCSFNPPCHVGAVSGYRDSRSRNPARWEMSEETRRYLFPEEFQTPEAAAGSSTPGHSGKQNAAAVKADAPPPPVVKPAPVSPATEKPKAPAPKAPADDPRPPLAMGKIPLPDREVLWELNGYFRRAVAGDGSGKSLLFSSLKTLDCSTSVYAQWLLGLLDWHTRHPSEEIRLPGPPEMPAPDPLWVHRAADAYARRVEELEKERRRQRRRQMEEHTDGGMWASLPMI